MTFKLRKPPRLKRQYIKGRRGMFVLPGFGADHAPGDLCGGRRLVGREFKARKAELEAREAAAREKRVMA